MYIGEVLDIYAKGSGSRYGSVLTADGIAGLSVFSLQVYRLIEMAQYFFTVDPRSLADRCYIRMTTMFRRLTLPADTNKNSVCIHVLPSAIASVTLDQQHSQMEVETFH